MNVVLLGKSITSLIGLVLQQEFRLIGEDDLYSSLPEVSPFFFVLPECGVPQIAIVRMRRPPDSIVSDGSILC